MLQTNTSARPLAALIRLAPEGLGGFMGLLGGSWGSRGSRGTWAGGECEARRPLRVRGSHGTRGACGSKSGSKFRLRIGSKSGF